MSAPVDLGTMKAEYEEAKQREDATFDVVLEAALLAYSNALQNAERQCKKDGDLESLLAVRTEQDRFSQLRVLPRVLPEGLPQSMRQVHASSVLRVEQAGKTRRRNYENLTKRHRSALETLKKQLTSDDRIDDALKVQVEIKSIDATASMLSEDSSDAPQKADKARKSVRSSTLSDGLVIHYTFDAVSKSGVPDLAGGKYPARIVGKYTSVPGLAGKAVRLEQGNYLLIPTFPLDGVKEFTVAIVVKDEMAVQVEHGEAYVSWGDTEQGGWIGVGQMKQNILCFSAGSNSINLPLQNEWRRKFTAYCLVCKNNQIEAYVDGVRSGASAVQSTQIASKNGGIGTHWWAGGKGTSSRFVGEVDDVRLYQRALSEPEIKSLCLGFKPGN